jgi:SAM-dependent methyltransferase
LKLDYNNPLKIMSYYEAYWEKNADWHPSKGGWRDREEEMLVWAAGPGSRLLDYGCGDCERIAGRIMGRGVDYQGFDISQTAVTAANERGVPAFLLSDEGQIDRRDGEFDAAICLEVMEHLMRPDLAAKEIFRVLKPDGKALISVPNPGYIPQRLEFLFNGFLNPGGSPLTSRSAPWKDAHIRFFTLGTMTSMLRESGFTKITVKGFHFTLQDFPWFYRQKFLFPVFKVIKWAFGWLGKVAPSLFAPRWYFLAVK